MIGEKENPNKNSIIFIYAILAFIILIPILNGKIFLIDFIPKMNNYGYNLFYGKIVPEYGGRLLFDLTSMIIPAEVFQKVFLFMVLLLSGYSMHYFVTKMGLSNVAGFYAGFLYMINPFTYIRMLAGYYVSYALIPLLLLFFINFLKNRGQKEILKFIFLLSVIALNIHMLIISLIIISKLYIFMLKKDAMIETSKAVLICILLFVLLNSYWIIPVLTAKNTLTDNIGEKDFDTFATKGELFNIAAMYGFWREEYLYAKDFLPAWQILYLIMLLLCIIGFISYYKDEKFKYVAKAMVATGIIGFVLATGVNGPFGEIIRWLFENSILRGFRDSHKFIAMMVVSYSVLGGLGVNRIKSVYDKYNKVQE